MTVRELTVVGYLLVVLTIIGLTVAAHLGRRPVPTLSAVFTRLMRRRTTRIGLLLAWWWAGWHFFAK